MDQDSILFELAKHAWIHKLITILMLLVLKFHLFVQKMRNVKVIIVCRKGAKMIMNAHTIGKCAQMGNVWTDAQH